MSVERWDPAATSTTLTDGQLAKLLEAAGRLNLARFGLDADTAGALAPLARHQPAAGVDWARVAERLDADQTVALIRLFTLAERELSGWEAGAASPVVPLARVLKQRGGYPAELTAWIKAHTDNRFLPYGNLMDRL